MPEEPQRQIIFQIMIALENLQKIREKIENVSAPTFLERGYPPLFAYHDYSLEKRPSRANLWLWRAWMTIGIAVLAAEGSNPPDHVILLADTKGSFGDEFSMNQLHKLFIDPKLGLYTVAADQMDKAAELFKTIHLFMTDLIGPIGYGRLFQAVHGASDTYKRIRFKYDILPKYAHIPPSIPDDFNESHLTPTLLEEWRNYYFGCQMVVSSFDTEGKPYLFLIDGTGEVLNLTFPGFAAIGSGREQAMFWLSYRHHNLGLNVKRATFHAFEAKLMAESSPFVNEQIDLVIANKDKCWVATRTNPKPEGIPITVAELQELFGSYGPKETDDLGKNPMPSASRKSKPKK